MSYSPIVTEYAGARFRSRLEARWAAFFDLCGWRWEYEPPEQCFAACGPRRGGGSKINRSDNEARTDRFG
jgi:hypothetical protein